MSIKLSEKPIGWFKPDPNNVKMHSDQQIEHLMASIQAHGFRDPIGAMPDGLIVEGHGRYEAAKRLNFKRVPVLVLEGMTDAEARAYAIAHNQTTLNTGLDQTAVREEFQRLDVSESDYPALGYTSDDILFLMDDSGSTGGRDHNGHERENLNALVEGVIHTEITFGSQEQFDRFTRFLTVLRLRYPNCQTISERIDSFVQEYGNGN